MSDDATTKDIYKQMLGSVREIDYSRLLQSTEVAKVQGQIALLDRFSVAETISAIAEEIQEIERNSPDKRFVVMMRTPDGRMMQIYTLRPRGFSTFVGEGWIDDMKCKVLGHVSTLSVFVAIEDKDSKKPVGFKIGTATTVSQPESEPSESDKKQSDH